MEYVKQNANKNPKKAKESQDEGRLLEILKIKNLKKIREYIFY